MKHLKRMKRLIPLLLAFVLLLNVLSVQLFAAEDASDPNQNNGSGPVEEWVYTPASSGTRSGSAARTTGASSDIIRVKVTAEDRITGVKDVPIEGADVNLYVGTDLRATGKTGSDGFAEISLAGLSYVERQNATVSANKIVSRGKAVTGTGRDRLFQSLPKDEDGEYYRYTMELHSETIDKHGNWLGAPIPKSIESNKIDIVFAIDATGSMSDEINNVKTNIASFSENLIDSGLDIRFCIIEYRDITIGEPTIVHKYNGSQWLTSIDAVVSELASIDADGGGDRPETVLDPLGYIADNSLMQWRSNAHRFAFVLTDADYKTNNNYGYTSLAEVVHRLAELNVISSVITSNSYKSTYSELFGTTGGIFANINSSSFNEEMLALSNNIVASVTREMTLQLHEPRMLVNMSVCYFADDATSQSDEYRNAVKSMLNAFSHRIAEATDGHILLDKVLLFSTANRMNFYFDDIPNIASMADIQIQAEVNDDGTGWNNVIIHNNSYVFGFFTDYQIQVDQDYMDRFQHLKDADSYLNKNTFVRIISSGIDINGKSMIDNVYDFSATQAHEAGHYLMGFYDEYLNANGEKWRDVGGKPYSNNFGLMENQYNSVEISTSSIEYAYMGNNFDGTDILLHTAQSWERKGSCEDTLADWMTDGIEGTDFSVGDYVSHYSKVDRAHRTATYSYAELTDEDFLTDFGRSGGRSGSHAETGKRNFFPDASFTRDRLVPVTFNGKEGSVTAALFTSSGYTCSIGVMKSGDEDFTEIALTAGKAELPIAPGEMAEVRVVARRGSTEQYNTYYIDRSGKTDTGYLYMSADNASTAYVTADTESSYTFVADNTAYTNGSYFSVNQATRISSDNGAGFNSGEIYSVASFLGEIDYTTLCWFRYADGVWTALPTDYSEEENMNIGARADLAGEGLYVLMAKAAPADKAIAAKNLSYTQSTDLDAVVSLTFDDYNSNSKYYNVYYSETRFENKNDESVVVRSYPADSTALTLNLLERGRTVYAAVEIVLADGSRSPLSEIILIGGEADSDGDGIPDWYCDKYLLWGEPGEDKDIANSDDDGDGLTNLEEYLGGSDPTDPDDPVHTTNIPVESISVSASDLTICYGTTAEVTATVLPENASNKHVDWSSGDTSVATVEVKDGICTITAVGLGGSKIYAVTADGGYSAVIQVAVIEHPYSSTVIAPTCTEQGYTLYTCPLCGEGFVGAYVDALGHNFRNGVCTRCGAKDPSYQSAPCDGGRDCPSYAFRDVNRGDWFHEAVDFAVENGLFNGMSSIRFEPNTPMTRAMLVTVLWRYEGSPGGGSATFRDVPSGQWYTEAVSWAAANGIVDGVGNNRFDPNGSITREQLAAILFRYSQSKGYDTSERGSFAGFPDTNKISRWASDSYSWAVGEKLITGNVIRGVSYLDPQGHATRAQVATILMRYILAEHKTDSYDTKGHSYRFVFGIYSWAEAQAKASSEGGYLARIDDADEYRFVTSMLSKNGYHDTAFFIGARRFLPNTDYYFVDRDDNIVSGKLNSASSWASAYWLSGEPTFRYDGVEEWIVAIEYKTAEGRWVLNDIPDNASYPADPNCHGFIIEYEP